MNEPKPVSRTAEFTAGPLAVCEDGEEFFGVCDPKRTIPTKSGRVLTASFCSLADARLYAAAPDMYEAAEKLLESIAQMDPDQLHCSTVAVMELITALAKANGEAPQ